MNTVKKLRIKFTSNGNLILKLRVEGKKMPLVRHIVGSDYFDANCNLHDAMMLSIANIVNNNYISTKIKNTAIEQFTAMHLSTIKTNSETTIKQAN